MRRIDYKVNQLKNLITKRSLSTNINFFEFNIVIYKSKILIEQKFLIFINSNHLPYQCTVGRLLCCTLLSQKSCTCSNYHRH